MSFYINAEFFDDSYLDHFCHFQINSINSVIFTVRPISLFITNETC